MDISSLMDGFARDTGTPIQLAAGGQCALAFDQGVTIDLEHEPESGTLYVKSVVGTLPTDVVTRHLLLLRLMVANGFDPVTRSAAIACEADEKTLVLLAKLQVCHTPVAALTACIEQMVSHSISVSNAIANACIAKPQSPAVAPIDPQAVLADASQLFNHA